MLFLITLLGVLICILLIYSYSISYTRQWKYIKQFPGSPTLPLIGNGHQLGLDPAYTQPNMVKMWEENGRTNFRVVIGMDPFVMLCKPKDVEKVLGDSEIIDKPDLYNIFHLVFGNGLLFSTGHKWKTMRKLLQPAFHLKVLEKYLKIMNKSSYKLADKMRSQVNKGSFNIGPYIRNYALDVLCSTTMGVNLNAQDNSDQPYIVATANILYLLTKRWFSVWKKIDFLYKYSSDYKELKNNLIVFHGTSENLVKERKKNLQEALLQNEKNITSEDSMGELTEKGYHSFIDLMILRKMSDGTPIPDKNIQEEIDIFLFAGHDTTTASISFALLNLAKYPEMQDRVLDEQKSIFHDDYNREPNSQDLNEMKFLENFIKETLRIYPPVSQYGRKVKKDILMEDGKLIPAGTNVIIFLPGLYNDPEIYIEPHVFNPDRYLDPMHFYSHVSFAAGPRICIGMRYAWMEVKTTLSILLRKYEFGFEGPEMEPKVHHDIVIRTSNGIRLVLKDRVKNKNI